jgi:hypothetical protein
VQSQSAAKDSGQDLVAPSPSQGLTTPDPSRPKRTRKKAGKELASLSQLSDHDVTSIVDKSIAAAKTAVPRTREKARPIPFYSTDIIDISNLTYLNNSP